MISMVSPIAPVPPAPTSPPQKPFFPILITILVLFLLSAVGLLAYQNWTLQQQISTLQAQPTPAPSLTPTPTTDPTANWETYTVRTVGLEFKLPDGLKEKSPFKEMVRPGDTGKYLCATFNASTMFSACTPNSFGIGTTSPNFTAGRGGVFL